MSSILPIESLEQILYIFKNDKKTLHSCILVNRFWCSTASTILYRNPFRFLRKPSSKFIRTLISCLSQSSKELLIQAHVNPEILNLPTPTLHYPSFIRYLDYEPIYNSVFELSKEIYSTQQNKDKNKYKYDINMKRLFTSELCKLIISSTPVIKHLIFDIQHIQDLLKGEFHFDIESIINTPNSKVCLSQVKKLEYGGIDDLDNMNLLSNYCNEINSLEINFCNRMTTSTKHYLNDRLITNDLIGSQIGLKKIILRGRYENLRKIFLSIKTQIQSLTYLELFECYLQDKDIMEIISNCYNLETLKFIECYDTTFSQMIPLTFSRFEKLKRLEFKRNNLGSGDPLISVFKNSRNCLKELVINHKNSRYQTRVDSMLIDSIGLYCQNLSYLEISITHNVIIQWYDTLKLLNNLKKLFIIEKALSKNEEFWKNTSINLPPSLLDFAIYIGDDNFNDILNWVMKNCKIHLDILQLLGKALVEPKGIEYIVDYYHKFGSLKLLALNKHCYTLQREILMYVQELFKVSFIGPIELSIECQKHSSFNNDII